MEFIEPKPVEKDPGEKKKKIIIGVASGVLALGALATGMTLLVNNIFLDLDHIEFYTYRHRIEEGLANEVEIVSINDGVTLPKKLRLPNKLSGYPVTKIGDNCFSMEENLEEIVFPDSLKEIGASAFQGCTNLARFNNPSNLSFIGTDAFSDTKWLSLQEDGLVTVGHFLYTYNGSMIEDSVIVASKDSPEYDTHSGDVINLGEYVNVSDGVFKNQTNLVYAEIPDAFTHINANLFEGCTNLEKVVLGNNITSIGDSAFEGCESLVDINLPNSIKTIGEYAFFQCDLDGEIVLPSEIDDIGSYAFGLNTHITKVTFPYKENGGLDGISAGLFSNCSSLETLVFDDKEFASDTSHISYIRSNAFKNTKLTSIKVPYNVSSVDSGAFEGITTLTSATFYNNTTAKRLNTRIMGDDGAYKWSKSAVSYQGVVVFGDRVFCGQDPHAVDPGAPSVFKSIRLIDDNGLLTADNKISLPLTLKNLGSSTKDSYIFTYSSITEIDLSKDYSVVDGKYINDSSFKAAIEDIKYVAPYLCYKVNSLTSIDFTGNSKMEYIYRGAFADCTSLATISLPNTLKGLEAEAFSGCTSLNGVDITNISALRGIGGRLFAGCTSLTSFNISKNIVQINDGAFEGATNLKTVTFEEEGSEFKTINADAFKDCVSLDSINIPAGTTSIGNNAFENCAALKAISLKSVSSLGVECFKNSGLLELELPAAFNKVIPQECFNGAASLSKLHIMSPVVVTLGKDALTGTNITSDGIYVLAELVDSYKANESWAAYKDYIKPIIY